MNTTLRALSLTVMGCLIAACGASSGSSAPAGSPAVTPPVSSVADTVELSLTPSTQAISPVLVGNNVWYNPAQQVWDLSRDGGVKIYRIGGHAYDSNMPSADTLMGWVLKAEAAGAQVVMQASQYQTPAQAAALVKYFNVEKHGNKPILRWSIGNEPWLQANRPTQAVISAQIEAYFKPIAAAMKEVDPTIKIYGVDECEYFDEEYDNLFGGKNDITGKVPGKNYYYVDGLSVHRYPQGSGDPAVEGIPDMQIRIEKAAKKAREVNALQQRTDGSTFGWALTEYNAKGGSYVHTWGNGQMFGAVLGMSMKNGADFTNTWSMAESSGNRGATDFGAFDGPANVPRASYWHMQLVSKNFSGTYVDGKSASPDLIVFGARSGKQLSVMVMNIGSVAHGYSLPLSATLAAPAEKTYKDTLAARSTHVLVFDLTPPLGAPVMKTQYSSTDFDQAKGPSAATVAWP